MSIQNSLFSLTWQVHYSLIKRSTWHSLNSRSLNVKVNYKQKYQKIFSSSLCSLCKQKSDDQEHIINCEVLKWLIKTREVVIENCVYDVIFADHPKQKRITHLFYTFLEIRNILLDENLNIRDPSTLAEVLRRCDIYIIVLFVTLLGNKSINTPNYII